jgi:predicted esterase
LNGVNNARLEVQTKILPVFDSCVTLQSLNGRPNRSDPLKKTPDHSNILNQAQPNLYCFMVRSLHVIPKLMWFRTTYIIATILISLQATAQVQVARENVIVSSQIHGFWEYLPADYNTNPTKKYPLLIEWHGVGETGNGSLPALDMVRIHGVARVVRAGIFPQSVSFNGQSYSYIVLSPQYIDALGMNIAHMDAFLDYAFSHYRVDRNRVYMTGYSLGAMLLYQFAGFNSTLAQKVTGIVPVSPCSDANFGNAQTIAANNVAVYGIHGAGDFQCPWQWTVNWSNLINTANGAAPIPSATYSLTPGLNPGDPHDIFWFTFEQAWSAPPVNKSIYSWMIQYSRNIALPLTLKNFSVDYKDRKILVSWTTSSESNTKEFNIERAGKDLQFRKIGTIPASGITSIDKAYSWVDDSPLDGINYYRIQIVNLDNSTEYFEIKNILVSGEGKVNLLSSNPVKGFLKLGIDLDRQQKVVITLLDIQGRVLHERTASYQQGRQEIIFTPTGVPSGTYLLKVMGEYFTESKKIVLQ